MSCEEGNNGEGNGMQKEKHLHRGCCLVATARRTGEPGSDHLRGTQEPALGLSECTRD